MTCKKVFWENPYQTELQTAVSGVEGDVITLRETIAYAFSGGQQSDSGTINGLPILEAKKDGKQIRYTLAPGHGLRMNDPVKLRIDWDKRYRIMKLHFAAEIILELVNQNFGNPEKIGANITSEKARIDFIWEDNIASTFPVLEAKAKALIDADLPIISAFSDEAAEIRYWKIEGFGQVPCGGTHPKRTGEIGSIRLRRERQGKSRERIEIYLA